RPRWYVQFPALVQPFARPRRGGRDGMFKHGFVRRDRAQPFSARQLVSLCGHDRAARDRRRQPAPGPDVAFQAGMTAVDQQKRRDEGWTGGTGGTLFEVPSFLPLLPISTEIRARHRFEFASISARVSETR